MQTTSKRGIYLIVDGKEVSRKDYIRDLFINGLDGEVNPGSRSDIVRYLNDRFPDQKVIFQQVYQATSDLQSTSSSRGRKQIVITLPDGSEVARRDFIKQTFEHGNSEFDLPSHDRGAIVKFLREKCDHVVAFQIVYQATC